MLLSDVPLLRATSLALALTLTLTGCGNDTDKAAEHLQKADSFLAKNDAKAAVIELKNALQLAPNNAAARAKLGQVYLNRGQGLEALKELQRAQSLGFKDAQLARSIVQAMLITGKFTEALAVIKSDGKNEVDWKVVEGNAYLGLENIDQAKAAYNAALELKADDAAAQRGLARIAMLTGDNTTAQGFISKAMDSGQQELQTLLLKGELEISMKSYAAAEKTFLEALKVAANSPSAHLGAARALLAQEKPDAAHTHIAALEKLKIGGPQVSYLKAVEARLKDNPDQAISALRDVLKVIPDHAPSLLLLGQIRFQRRELDQARNLLEQYVAKTTASSVGRKLLAAVYLEQNQADKAIATLRPVEQVQPNDPQALSLLGTAYLQLGKFERGKEYLKKAKDQAPKAAAIRTQLAISQLATGEQDKAIKELEEAISQDPKFERADYLVILSYLRKGDTAAAMRAAKNLISKDPGNAIAHNLLGAVHEVAKEYPAARKAYQHVLELDPKSRAAMLNLARLDLQNKDMPAAQRQLETILKNHPDDSLALLGLARLASTQGQTSKGLEYLERARKKNPQALQPRLVLGNFRLRSSDVTAALELAREARKIAPENPAGLLLLGRSQLANNQVREAINNLQHLVDRVPKAAMSHFYLALAQQRSGATELAKNSLHKALALEPENPLVLATLGQLESSSGNNQNAGEIADKLAKLIPDAPAAEALRGDILARQKNWSEALGHYRNAFKKNPSGSLLAKIYSANRQLGKLGVARKLLTDWLDSNPDDLATRVLLASADQQDNKQDTAIANYEAVLKRLPEHVVALNNLSWLYYQKKDARALEYAKRAYDKLPDRPEIIDTYGWMLLQNGQTEHGLQLLDKAVAGAPDNGDIRYHRAFGLNRVGDTARAKQELEQLLATAVKFSEREHAQTLLEKLNALN